MASPNEIKRVVEEKVIPLFESGRLERLEKELHLLSKDIAALRETLEKVEKGYDKQVMMRVDSSGRAKVVPKK